MALEWRVNDAVAYAQFSSEDPAKIRVRVEEDPNRRGWLFLAHRMIIS